MRQLLAGFEAAIPRRGPGLAYRVTLLMTAFAIVILMMIYFGIIAGTAYGVYWYAVIVMRLSWLAAMLFLEQCGD